MTATTANLVQEFCTSALSARDNLVCFEHSITSEPAASGDGEDHTIILTLGVDYTNAYNLDIVITISHVVDDCYDSAIRAHNNDWADLRTIAQYIPQGIKFFEQFYGDKFKLINE